MEWSAFIKTSILHSLPHYCGRVGRKTVEGSGDGWLQRKSALQKQQNSCTLKLTVVLTVCMRLVQAQATQKPQQGE